MALRLLWALHEVSVILSAQQAAVAVTVKAGGLKKVQEGKALELTGG